MRAQRNFRPTFDAALEDRVALTSLVPAALHPVMSLNLAPYHGAPISPSTTAALTLAASRPAVTHYVPAGYLNPTPFVGHSIGTGTGTSGLNNLLNTGLNRLGSSLNGLGSSLNNGLSGLGSSLNSGLGSTLNSGSGGLNPALGTFLNGLGSSLNSGLGSSLNSGLGSSLNSGLGSTFSTGSSTNPTSVAQFIAGVPFFGGSNTPSFSAGMTLPMTNSGTTGLGTMNSGFSSFGGNTFGSSVFSTNSFGSGMRF